MDHEKKLAWAQFRFSVIAPLVCRHIEDEGHRRALRAEILNQVYVTPDGHHRRIGNRTLNDWLARYKKNGLEGLLDITRKTRGTCRAIPLETLQRAVALRREIPARSVKAIIRLLEAEDFDVSKISKSTLNAQLNRLGVSKEKLSSARGAYQRWEQKFANALWQADTSSGVWLPDPTNPKKVKQTRLISFIDDASRVCVHAEFYWNEKLPSLIDCFRKALLKRGKAARLLCDNAFIYHSTTMELMCAQLGIEISFCKEYSPEGKGKIEKHYGTIKDGFYKEAEHAALTTLEELNQFFWAWLTKEYHQSKHSSIGMPPLERWRMDEHLIKRVCPDDVRRALKLRAQRTVNKKTALIRLENRYFQTSIELAGCQVEVRWQAGLPDEVEVWQEGRMIEMAQHTTASTNIDFTKRPERERLPRGLPLASSKNYKNKLLAQHQGEAPLPAMPADDYLAEQEFIALFATALARDIPSDESPILSQFFFQHSPLRKSNTQALLSQAVSAKGEKRHLRYYLEHIQRSIFNKRR